MAHLKVRLRGKTVYDLQLSPHRSYVGGRKEDCDIILENDKGISREHFKIFFQAEKWHLEVLSRFGEITSDGEKVQTLELDGHRLFSLPPYEFEYSEMSTALVAVGGKQVVGSDLSSEPYVEGEKTFVGTAHSVPHIKVLNEFGDVAEMFRLENGDSWVAGRESSCDILIRDQRVSRRQFEIRREGSHFVVMDLASVNGTFLNEARVSSTEAVLLKSGDSISVLDNRFYFELHDPDFKARLELVQASTPARYMPQAQELMPAPQFPVYQNPGLPPLQETGPKKFDFEKHRSKLIIGAILIIGVAYFFSDQGAPKPPPQPPGMPGRPQDAFTHLTPEQQVLVKQTYQLAKNLYMQAKYELSKAEIAKVYELVPDYEDIKDIERLCNEAMAIQEERRRVEEAEKNKLEIEAKVQKQVAECKGKLNPNYTSGDLDACLAPVLEFNPDHPDILQLRSQVEALMAAKQMSVAKKQEYQDEVKKLQNLFNRAEGTRKAGNPLKAVKDYEVVIGTSLPDPHDVKGESRKQIAAIQAMIKQKTDGFTQEADKAYTEQRLKDSIMALRKAAEFEPDNADLKEKIDKQILELKKQMIIFYQEGVLEESYGNVEGNDSKPGAKEKWKKIMGLDIPDGEYYIKAKIKLKKYGAI